MNVEIYEESKPRMKGKKVVGRISTYVLFDLDKPEEEPPFATFECHHMARQVCNAMGWNIKLDEVE